MTRTLLLIVLFATILTGCNLASDDTDTQNTENDHPNVQITDVAENPTQQSSITPRPTQTPQPSPTPRTITNPTAVIPCTIRSDWPEYRVQGGDTTSAIARATGSTVRAISDANCLDDPSRISVGQMLRVPRLPTTGTQTIGTLSLNPVQSVISGVTVLRANETVIITWQNAPTDLALVEFYISPNRTDYQIVTRDQVPSNGSAASFIVPIGMDGELIAIGKDSNGRDVAVSAWLRVAANLSEGVVGDIVVSPYLLTTENGYMVEAGKMIQLSWATVGNEGPLDYGVLQAEFLYTPLGQTTPISIGIDNNPSDGFTTNWTVPNDADGKIQVSGRLPGEAHNGIESRVRYITAVSGVEIGRVDLKPTVRVEGDWHYFNVGSNAVLTWVNLPPAYVTKMTSVTFYKIPVTVANGTVQQGAKQLIGTDGNIGDGINLSWTIPPGLHDYLVAEAVMSDGRTLRTGAPLKVISLPLENENTQSQIGVLMPRPGTIIDPDTYELEAGTQVTLVWPEAPTVGVNRIEFYMAPTGTNSTFTLFGTDTNASDGTSYTFTVSSGLLAYFTARAFMNDGSVQDTAKSIRLYAE